MIFVLLEIDFLFNVQNFQFMIHRVLKNINCRRTVKAASVAVLTVE